MKWINVEDSLPEPDSIKDIGNPYYIIMIEGYHSVEPAMYLENEYGELGWYTSYISKVIKPVTKWANPN